MRSRKVKKHTRVKSAKRFIGIIQTVVCYVPQIRTWHDGVFIRSTSKCIMRKPKVNCLDRVWGRV